MTIQEKYIQDLMNPNRHWFMPEGFDLMYGDDEVHISKDGEVLLTLHKLSAPYNVERITIAEDEEHPGNHKIVFSFGF
jgi:hypothetical protein